jgi:signal transduction histidine kinase
VTSLERITSILPRPLDPVRSIKLKLGLLVIASEVTGLVYFRLEIGWIPPVTTVVMIGLALLTTLILAHGTTRPLREMTAAARAMARGDYSKRVRATSRDEVGELAVAFNLMSADLAAADQHRRELIANVSHELRTPIAALQAVLENIVDGVAGADPVTLRTALAQTERLGRLVGELLDLSRIDAGAHRLDESTFDLATFVDEVVAESRVVAEAAGRAVRFVATITPGGASAKADRDRLKQVVLNLLDNAGRHSPAGTEVLLGARSDASGLTLEVRDFGAGIAPGDRDRVFERFTRGERATGGGTGLGLAIARWVVNLHGGAIAVVDDTRSGCLIRVVLPGAAPSRTGTDAVDAASTDSLTQRLESPANPLPSNNPPLARRPTVGLPAPGCRRRDDS